MLKIQVEGSLQQLLAELRLRLGLGIRMGPKRYPKGPTLRAVGQDEVSSAPAPAWPRGPRSLVNMRLKTIHSGTSFGYEMPVTGGSKPKR